MELWECFSNSTSNVWDSSDESGEDESLPPWKQLMKNLSDFYLDSFCAIFKEKSYTEDNKRKPEEVGLNKEEFIEAINEVFGHDKYISKAVLLYNEINKNEESTITWDQFLDYAITAGKTVLSPKLKLCTPKIYSVPHAQRETITKIVLIETDRHFCYAVVSKYGRVGLYDGNMNFLTSYHSIIAREDIHRTDQERRRRNRWITDAIFLPDILMFAVTNSTRSLVIYDASGLKHIPLWLILGMPNVINSLAYYGSSSKGKCILYMGDELGFIQSLNFVQPKIGLFRKKHSDKLNIFYWRELPGERSYVIVKNHGRSHKEIVTAMEYIPENDTLISCSRDPEASVIIRQTSMKRLPFLYKMTRGTSCFSYSKKLGILTTGSDNGIIRIWNHIMPSKPLAILKGHSSAIGDVVILENTKLLLSCSRDGMFSLWDMVEYQSLQAVKLKYPPFKILGRAIEWGKKCIFPGPKRQHIKTEPSKYDAEKMELDNDLEVNKNPSEDSKNRDDGNIEQLEKWERSYILVTCCNFIAQIDLSFYEISIAQSFEATVLPPPPLQNSVLIPSSWNICNRETVIDFEKTETDEKTEEYIKSLSFILDKDLLEESNKKNNINLKISKLETQKLKMNGVVSQCAPFLALHLHEIEEVKINPNLVIPNRKRIRSLVEKTNRMLSSAASRSQIFSESSSRSRSSRSSIVEFDV